MKIFSIAGPVNSEDYYCLPLSTRLDERELRLLIKQKKYFILHAPRQTGKTSTMINFAKTLNAEGVYTALYVNVESAQAARGDSLKGMYTILEEFLNHLEDQLPGEKKMMSYLIAKIDSQKLSGSSLKSMLQYWAKNSTKPIIVSPVLSEQKKQQLQEKLEKPDDLVVFALITVTQCDKCKKSLPKENMIFLETDRPLCLSCAGLDTLAFLPRGDAKFSLRAKKYSTKFAVVLKFSRNRGRYERQGILVQPEALEKAKSECSVVVAK